MSLVVISYCLKSLKISSRFRKVVPTSLLAVFASASKKKKIYFENLKKISYEPHRNFLQQRRRSRRRRRMREAGRGGGGTHYFFKILL